MYKMIDGYLKYLMTLVEYNFLVVSIMAFCMVLLLRINKHLAKPIYMFCSYLLILFTLHFILVKTIGIPKEMVHLGFYILVSFQIVSLIKLTKEAFINKSYDQFILATNKLSTDQLDQLYNSVGISPNFNEAKIRRKIRSIVNHI